MLSFARIYPSLYLVINGLLYAALAWLFLVEPVDWFARLQIDLRDPVGYAELKTMYVGVMGSLGVFFLSAGIAETFRRPGLWLAVISYAAFATVRGWAIFVEQFAGGLLWQLWVTEIVSLVAGLAALYCQHWLNR